jgi:hypothetical protein
VRFGADSTKLSKHTHFFGFKPLRIYALAGFKNEPIQVQLETHRISLVDAQFHDNGCDKSGAAVNARSY